MANKGTSYITNPDNMPITADGSTTPRILSERFGDTINVKDFGAVGDGVTDDTSAIESAISAASSSGGGVVRAPAGVYRLTRTLNIDTNNTFILGDGGGGYGAGIGILRDTAKTRFFWDDPLDYAVNFEPLDGGISQRGGGWSGVMIDCQNNIRYGLRLSSWERGVFTDFTVYGATEWQIYLTTTDRTLLANPYDCYRNYFRNVYTTAKNLTNTSGALRLGSGEEVNSCYNEFHHCWFEKGEDGGAPSAILLENTDNNIFLHCKAESMEFGSSDQDTSSQGAPSRYNWQIACEISNTYCRASKTIGGASSFGNVVRDLNLSNGTGNVVVEQGSNGNNDAKVLANDIEKYLTRVSAPSMSVGGNSDAVDEDEATFVLTTSNNDGNGKLHVKSTSATARSPVIQVTGSRNDTNVNTPYSGRVLLDSFSEAGAPSNNKALGSIYMGGAQDPATPFDMSYPACIVGRAYGDWDGVSYAPAEIELRAGETGYSSSSNSLPPLVLRVKPTGAINLQPSSTEPTSPEEGDMYFNSSTSKFMGYNGSAWVEIG